MGNQHSQLDTRRKQLIYRACHRGIKEMDLILGDFARDRIDTLDPASLDLLEALMEESDRDLLTWFTGEQPVPENVRTPLFEAILSHSIDKHR